MTRDAFLTRLRAGLVGMAPGAAADILADYESHFADGVAAGRSEAEVAAALGDPDRLARELKAEAGLARWEAERNPTAAANALFAVLGLGAIDVLVLLPILLPAAGVLFGLMIAALALFGFGAAMFAAGPFVIHGAPVAALVLAGLGLMASGTFLGSLTGVISIWLAHALAWFGRLHLRLLRPALAQPEAAR